MLVTWALSLIVSSLRRDCGCNKGRLFQMLSIFKASICSSFARGVLAECHTFFFDFIFDFFGSRIHASPYSTLLHCAHFSTQRRCTILSRQSVVEQSEVETMERRTNMHITHTQQVKLQRRQ